MTVERALQLRKGKTLVFTNGVFDILHVGHVRYLEYAATLGDLLIVGMNSDASVRGLGKGPNRPINPLEDRVEVLSSLRCVAGVVPFEEGTPEALISQLKPEIHIKGGDYTADQLPETRIVQAYGGKVLIFSTVEGRSSSLVIRKLGLE